MHPRFASRTVPVLFRSNVRTLPMAGTLSRPRGDTLSNRWLRFAVGQRPASGWFSSLGVAVDPLLGSEAYRFFANRPSACRRAIRCCCPPSDCNRHTSHRPEVEDPRGFPRKTVGQRRGAVASHDFLVCQHDAFLRSAAEEAACARALMGCARGLDVRVDCRRRGLLGLSTSVDRYPERYVGDAELDNACPQSSLVLSERFLLRALLW
jgi:hypothetical protein